MISSHPKLEYLQSKRTEFKKQVKKVQSELEAVVDVTLKETYENRLNLLFQQIAEVDQEIEALQQNLREQLITGETNRLIEILEANPEQWEIFHQSYQTTIFHWTSRSQRTVENVQSIVSELKKIIPGKSSYTALEEFIAYLIDKTTDPLLVNALEQWRSQYRPNIDWGQLYNQIQSQQNQQLENAQPAILIAIIRNDEASTQSQEGATYYQLNAWLIEDIETYRKQNTGYHPLVVTGSSEAKPCLLEELLQKMPRFLNTFLAEQRILCPSCVNYPQVHVFLPVELMDLAVDSWRLNPETDLRPECLGHDHIVVTRCANRYGGSYSKRPSWLKLWKRYQNLLRESIKNVFVSGHDSDLDALVDILNALVKPDDEDGKIIGLCITQSPLDNKKLFRELLLKFGLPIVIWTRNNLVDQMLHQAQMAELLDACCLEHLPKTVKNKRYDARIRENSPDCHIGHHLSLLWDDPSLVPPKSA